MVVFPEKENRNRRGIMAFSGVTYKPLGPLAAMTDLATGHLYLNSEIWDRLPDHWQRFILLHEEGHLVNGNLDEPAADLYARKKFIDHSSPELFSQSMANLQDILKAHERIPEADRLKISAELEKIPGFKFNPGFIWFLAIPAAINLGYQVYKTWDNTNKMKRAEKSARIAGENSAALQIFTAQSSSQQVLLYTGAGLILTAMVLYFLL